MRTLVHAAWVSGVLLLAAGESQADEGMWTLDNPPNRSMQEKYGFTASEDWVEHVRLAALRFGSGGSGGFVSGNGLVLTNHHVVLGELQKLSTPENDLVANGFFARTQEDERKCAELELYQLQSFDDVTARITAAIKDEENAHELRRAAISKLTEEETKQTGLRCEVVELYQGGEYWVYRYKVYRDVRMVMAPEASMGFYGGDQDNFTFPRHCFDFAFVRAYEDGKPVKPKRWFGWSENGAKEGELTFIAGHPGSTDRGRTLTQLAHERDHFLPFQIGRMAKKCAVIDAYQLRGKEEKRRGSSIRFSSENYYKRLSGQFDGLSSEKLFAKKADEEGKLRSAVVSNPELAGKYGSAWEKIDEAYEATSKRWKRDLFVLGNRYRGGELTGWAESLVRYVVEVSKPNEERLEEFSEASLERFRNGLFANKPSYPDLEEVLLGHFLTELVEHLGDGDSLVKELLKGQSPEDVARIAAQGTKLGEVAFREKLAGMSAAELRQSDDPMIRLAWIFDRHYREAREWNDENLSIVETMQGTRIAKASFVLYGKERYPDATSSLRLTFGQPKGYESGTTLVPSRTVMGGLFARHDSFGGQEPFRIADRVLESRSRVDLAVPLNFVTTHDITGGNSGSPVFNRNLKIVGTIFDSNIHGISNDYVYSEDTARAVSMHSAGILEALRSVYGMNGLAMELAGLPAKRQD